MRRRQPAPQVLPLEHGCFLAWRNFSAQMWPSIWASSVDSRPEKYHQRPKAPIARRTTTARTSRRIRGFRANERRATPQSLSPLDPVSEPGPRLSEPSTVAHTALVTFGISPPAAQRLANQQQQTAHHAEEHRRLECVGHTLSYARDEAGDMRAMAVVVVRFGGCDASRCEVKKCRDVEVRTRRNARVDDGHSDAGTVCRSPWERQPKSFAQRRRQYRKRRTCEYR